MKAVQSFARITEIPRHVRQNSESNALVLCYRLRGNKLSRWRIHGDRVLQPPQRFCPDLHCASAESFYGLVSEVLVYKGNHTPGQHRTEVTVNHEHTPTIRDPFPQSLCHRCCHVRLLRSKRGSVFIRCDHPEVVKYPRQPALTCTSFSHRAST